MTKRILIVEDEPKTAAYLQTGLEEHGWKTDIATDGEAGLIMALERDYELLILDIMLPVRDGWSVVAALRKSGSQTPVVCLTARDAVGEKVKGLDLGADDYLVKPFAFSELLARLRSVLRRGSERQATRLRVANLEIDLVNHKAFRADTRLDLSPKEFSLLHLLARHAGEVVGRNLIAQEVWEMSLDGETNLVDVSVKRLRRKVDQPFPKPLIHTVYGVGYVLEER